MKLTRGNSFATVFILLLSACTYKPETEIMKGNWKYESISKDGKAFLPIGDNDVFKLTDDSFYYDLELAGKHMSGTWTYSERSLHLHYNQPDTVRHFEMDVISEKQMKFHEGPVQFSLKKIKTD